MTIPQIKFVFRLTIYESPTCAHRIDNGRQYKLTFLKKVQYQFKSELNSNFSIQGLLFKGVWDIHFCIPSLYPSYGLFSCSFFWQHAFSFCVCLVRLTVFVNWWFQLPYLFHITLLQNASQALWFFHSSCAEPQVDMKQLTLLLIDSYDALLPTVLCHSFHFTHLLKSWPL